MNWAWWDGKMPEHWQHDQHPLDKSTAAQQNKPPGSEASKPNIKPGGDGI